MAPIIESVLEATPRVIDQVARDLPKRFPAELFDKITTNLEKSAERLAAMPAR